MKKPRRIVVVEWLDAWHDGSAYTKPEEAIENIPLLMVNTGFLVSKTRIGVTLASSTSSESGDYRHLNFIPSGMIQRIREVK